MGIQILYTSIATLGGEMLQESNPDVNVDDNYDENRNGGKWVNSWMTIDCRRAFHTKKMECDGPDQLRNGKIAFIDASNSHRRNVEYNNECHSQCSPEHPIAEQ